MEEEKRREQIRSLSHPPFNPIIGFPTFYFLDYLLHLATKSRWKGVAFQRFFEQLSAFKQYFDARLADLLADYLALICFGEARWALFKSNGPYVLDVFLTPPSNRLAAYLTALDYDPERFLPLLKTLFEINDWEYNYGGSAWANLADVASRRSSMSDRIFCNTVINLEHNMGTCFNKGCLIQSRSSSLMEVLSDISYDEVTHWLKNWPISTQAFRFLRWADRLGVVKIQGVSQARLCFPPRLEWGTKVPQLLRITGDQPKDSQEGGRKDGEGVQSG